MAMDVIGWIVLGLIAGFIASKLVNKRGDGVVPGMVLGIVGAVVGGWLFNAIGAGVDLWSLLVAFVGAVVLLVFWHAVSGFAARMWASMEPSDTGWVTAGEDGTLYQQKAKQ